MDAEQLLRRYLEQRREMGERELVLDELSVDDVMKLVGMKQSSVVGRHSPVPDADSPAVAPVAHPVAARGAPPERQDTNASADSAHPSPAAPSTPPPPSIVVGNSGRELFGGAIMELPTLEAIAQAVATCTRCPLYATAISPVPGDGPVTAQLMCVGEAPGANEDASGHPFVGAAGQLLTKILAAIDLKREDVFICNVLKHRPPGNRNPEPNEVEACSPYLVRQVELVKPKVIVAFGLFAAQSLLNTKLGIGKLRGAVHRYHGIPVVVTYHPAALLRNPAWKRPTWEDVQLARRVLDDAPA